jgi:thioredoxin 1
VSAAPSAGRVQPVTDASFAQFTASGLALVDFSAEWCPPCRRMDPLVEQLAGEMPQVAFGRLDVDANPRTAASQGVLGMPTFILYKDGRKVGQVVGAVPKPRLAEAVLRHL